MSGYTIINGNMKNLYIFLLVFTVFLTPEAPTTYWDGAGDTPGMTAYEQQGHFLRFTEFPILVYMLPDEMWESALESALLQLSEVLPIQRTTISDQADILISLVAPADFQAATPCLDFQTEGCAVIHPVRLAENFSVIGHVWINTASPLPPQHLLLHELIHALGLLVHSPLPDDVMYNGSDSFPLLLSPRDRTTLRQLYTSPAWD